MKKYKFNARIEGASSGGACVFFPYDTEKEFGTKGRVPVKATFDGVPYTGSMVKYGFPQHMLPILKALRAQIGKQPGDTVTVEVWKDDAVRTLEVPTEFKKLLKKHDLLAVFEELSYTNRKEYVRWVSEAKKEETRNRRLEKSITLLKRGVKTPG
jgi:hypothetical protein